MRMRREFIAGKFHLKIEPAVFDIGEYEAFLHDNAASIHAFEARRRQAFEEEKQRWIANGQLTFETRSGDVVDAAPEAVLKAGEEGVYAPVAGSIWKLNVAAPGTRVKAGEVKSGQCLFAVTV